MSDGQKKGEQTKNHEGFTAADFVSPTSRVSEAEKRLKQQEIADYNKDPALARTRTKREIVAALISFFRPKNS
jgi:hypothetical protein